MTKRDRTRPLGYRQERHRKAAMDRLTKAQKELKQIEAEARLLAGTRMTTEAVHERGLELIIRVQAAQLAIAEAQNELLLMRSAAADDDEERT